MKRPMFSGAYCDDKRLITILNKEFVEQINNDILNVYLLHKCYIDDLSLFNELKRHLKCPHCKKATLVYCSNDKIGYLRSRDSKKHLKVCSFFRKYYKRSNHKNTHVLKDSKELTDESGHNIMLRFRLSNNSRNRGYINRKLNSHRNKDGESTNIISKSHRREYGNRVRKLKWEHTLIPDDKKEICVIYGKTKSITIKYRSFPCYKNSKKYFKFRKVFVVKYIKDNKTYQKSPSLFMHSLHKNNIPTYKDNNKSLTNKYFVVICQIVYKYDKIFLNILRNSKGNPFLLIQSYNLRQ